MGIRLEDPADHGRVLLAIVFLKVPAEEALAAGLPEIIISE